MGYARYVGRVGALAVALGVGVAVATAPGVAWADEGADSASTSAGSDSQKSAANHEPGPATATAGDAGGQGDSDTGAGKEQPSEGEPSEESSGSQSTVDLGGGVVVSSSGGSVETDEEQAEAEPSAEPSPEPEPEPTADADPAPTVSRGGGSDGAISVTPTNTPQNYVDSDAVSATIVEPVPSDSAVAELASKPSVADSPLIVVADERDTAALQTMSAPAEDAPTSTPAPATTSLLASLLVPYASIDPNAPVDSPVMWVLAAAARRQFGLATEAREAATSGITGDVDTSLMLAVADAVLDEDADFGRPDPVTGTVTGVVVPPPGPVGKPTYTLTSLPAEGKFTFNKTTGAFTYTPTAAQRVLAGLSDDPNDPNDTVDFTVNVKYGASAATPVTVSIPISPTPIADIGTVATGDGAWGLAVTNTRAYVANASGTVTVIDTISGTKMHDIEIGGFPTGVAVSPDGKRLYVASQSDDDDGNTVTVFNTADDSVLAMVDLGDRVPQLMAISPNGKTLYVATAVFDEEDDSIVLDSEITKISTTTNTIIGAVRNAGLAPEQITVSPDGTKIFVISQVDDGTEEIANGVFVFSSTSTSARQINLGFRPVAFDISPDGKFLYVGDWNDGIIDVIDTKTYRVVGGFQTEPESIDEIVVNKDSTLLMVMNFQSQAVDVYDITNDYALLQSVPTDATTELNWPEAVLSPDGMQLYYTSDGALQIISLVPPNHAPVANGDTPGDPNAAGVVTGDVGITDGDDDVLKYTVTVAPTNGKVVVNPDGTFTYTPTAAARHAAAVNGAPAMTDTFIVEATDGRRGFATEEIIVDILPANAKPTYKISAPPPSATTGAVKGSVTATDADRDPLSYSAPATSDKGGAVVIDPKTGKFTYTPTAPMRHAAAVPGADKTDTFTVTIADGHGDPVNVTVTVQIRPTNAAPDRAAASLSAPDEGTGAIVGTVTAVDADGDAFTLTGPAITQKGSITYNSATKTFTYTPTAEARAAASASNASASAKTDTFTVTVNDGHGGTDTVSVKVNIMEVGNNNPEAGDYDAGAPTGSSGVVTGKVSADDPDDDPMTFSGSQTTAKGTVTVKSNGDFTYTPTSAARHAASINGAGTNLTTDTFNVTVSDGNGGTLSVPVTVDISPKNTAPSSARFTATQPNTTTGLVTGRVTSTDADGDVRTYSGPTTSVKGGTVQVNIDGTFSYTPSAAARQAAGAPGAPAAAKVDNFTVTINDGHSPNGTTTVNVQVKIAPSSTVVTTSSTDGAPVGGVIVGKTGTL
jgi:VCBS repeat-containing protein